MDHTSILYIKYNESNLYIKVLEYPVSVLCPKPGLLDRPYSSPFGPDANSLRLNITKKIGCEIKDDAIRFVFESSENAAIMYVNKRLIQFDKDTDRASIVCSLSGKYNFEREVKLLVIKERIDCIRLDINDIYLNDASSRPFNVKISSSVSIQGVVLQYGNKKTEPFNLTPDSQVTKNLGEVHKEDGKTCREIKVVATSEWSKPASSVCHIYSNHLKWEECAQDVVLYRKGKQRESEIRLCNSGIEGIKDIKISEVRGPKTVMCFPKKIESIGAGQSQTLYLRIKPDDASGERNIPITASYMDGKLSTPLDLVVKTLEPVSPRIVLSTDLCKGQDGAPVIYYVGQGKALIGTVTVTCEKTDSSIPDDGYLPINLAGVPPVCQETDKLFFKPKSTNTVLSIGKTFKYEMFLNLPAGFDKIERDEYGNGVMSLSARIGESSSSFRVPIEQQKKTLLIKDKRYENVFRGKCSYHIFDFILHYDAPSDGDLSKRHHQGGNIRISGDDRISFDENRIIQQLPIETINPGDNIRQVYYLAPEDWEQLENLNVDKALKNVSIEYVEISTAQSDPYRDSKNISSIFIRKLDDEPKLVIYYLDQNGDEVKVYSDLQNDYDDQSSISINLKAPVFEYTPKNNIYKSDVLFTLFFRNAQTLKNDNQFLNIQRIICKCNKKAIHFEDLSIKNGSEDVKLAIASDYKDIRSKNEITFSCVVEKEWQHSSIKLTITITVPGKMVIDAWRSLDIGTSGIVVAGYDGAKKNNPYIVPLKDVDRNLRIEDSEGILSSATIVKMASHGANGILQVAPAKGDLYSNLRVLPCKFLAGRKVLPFAKVYENSFPEGIEIGEEYFSWEGFDPKEIIKYTYSDVLFSRIPEDESSEVHKLVVTYPNTYTPLLLDELRKLIHEIFYTLPPEDLSLVPESDAVIAYYVNDVIINENGEGFGYGKKQTVVVYDMGAGTLDLSLATLESKDGKLSITIDKRLGLPIGGAFISEVLYRFLESEGAFLPYDESASEYSIKDRRRKRRELVEEVKYSFGSGKVFSYENDDRKVLSRDIDDATFKSCKELNDIIQLCTEDIFGYLTGVSDWKGQIDRVILSGRGSLFHPIREHIKTVFGNDKVYAIELEQLKSCVALGAIQYQRILKGLVKDFEIIHKNSYLNIGIYYCRINENHQMEYYFCEIVSSKNVRYNEDVNREFGILRGSNQTPINLSVPQEAIIFATPFNEETMREILKSKDDIRRCMITHLLSFSTNGVNNRDKVIISIVSDIDGTLNIKINSAELKEIQLVEHIEGNKYYQHYFSNK